MQKSYLILHNEEFRQITCYYVKSRCYYIISAPLVKFVIWKTGHNPPCMKCLLLFYSCFVFKGVRMP